MKTQSSKYYILLLLVLMFATPGIAAYLVYQHPNWLNLATINKGTLLNPPVLVSANEQPAKWRVIFWTPTTCDTACLQQLDLLARIRLALGRRLYLVDQWLLVNELTPAVTKKNQVLLQQLNFSMIRLSNKEREAHPALFAEAKIFIADPNNYLILSYPVSANPDDIYKDLKLVLNTTENKNG